jgi:hypothetical protein
MTLLQTLSDSNLYRFLTPIVIGLNAILCSWAVNQLPALKHAQQSWRILKLAIETAIFALMVNSWTDAVKGFSSNDSTAQIVGVAYFVLVSVILGAIIDDVGRLVDRSSFGAGIKRSTALLDREAIQWHHQRRALIKKVRLKWVRGVLEKSFFKTARIELELEEHPSIGRSELVSIGQERRPLPPGRRMFDEFTDLGVGGTLLILGEPGAGKTTQLLELARDLLDFTDAANLDQAVPVVLNLSSWGMVRSIDRQPAKTFHEWLVEELSAQYNLKREISAVWLKEEHLILLLDGLDDIPIDLRDECVAAINQFQRDYESTAMVVCSRMLDYEKLQNRFDRFDKSIVVLPLEPEQLEDYLQETGQSLEGVRVALQRDSELRALASKPLFLSILSLAYRGISADELVNRPNPERLRRLFDRYLERRFHSPISQRHQQEAQRFLKIVTAQMSAGRALLIDRLHPLDWLQQRQRHRTYRLIGGVVGGLIVGLMVGLLMGMLYGMMFGLVFGLMFGLEK